MNTNKYFDTEIARKFDSDTAIILYNIQFWVQRNRLNKQQHNYKNGKYWTHDSCETYTETFDWLSAKQIRTRLNKLVEAGYLEKGNFNKRKGDKTNWYTLTDQSDQMVKGSAQMVKGSAQMVKPLPYNKPYNKPNERDKENSSSSKNQIFYEGIMKTYNQLVGREAVKSSSLWSNNVDYWLTVYTEKDIIRAVWHLLLIDNVWEPLKDLKIFFRRRNSAGKVDHIGEMLIKEVPKPDSFRGKSVDSNRYGAILDYYQIFGD